MAFGVNLRERDGGPVGMGFFMDVDKVYDDDEDNRGKTMWTRMNTRKRSKWRKKKRTMNVVDAMVNREAGKLKKGQQQRHHDGGGGHRRRFDRQHEDGKAAQSRPWRWW